MFMDPNTYRISLTNVMKNKFEIDAIIAKTIQLLNKKGYKTLFCCGGHPKKDKYSPIYYEDGTVSEDGCLIEFFNQIYIAFSSDVTLPIVPSGFELENHGDAIAIYCTIDCDTDLKNANTFTGVKERLRIFKELLKKNYELFEWAKALPDKKKDINRGFTNM